MIKHEKWQLNNLRLLFDNGRVENGATRRINLVLRGLKSRLSAAVGGGHDGVVVARLAETAVTTGIHDG